MTRTHVASLLSELLLRRGSSATQNATRASPALLLWFLLAVDTYHTWCITAIYWKDFTDTSENGSGGRENKKLTQCYTDYVILSYTILPYLHIRSIKPVDHLI